MDLRLTPSQIELREEAAAFCEALRPSLEEDEHWWREGIPSDGDSREATRALGEAGWIGLSWPVELGGRGLTRLDATLVEEVLGYGWVPLAHYLLSYKTIGGALELFGSADLQERLLPPVARGELVFCQGFSEPGAGSDFASLTTRAERRGDVFVVNGHKLWTSSAQLADWIYLAVRTDPDLPRHRGISVLVAPIDTPGIEVRAFPTLGGGWLCETFLEQVEIPVSNIVGELNGGWAVSMATLDLERITAEKVGAVTWVADELERYLDETGRLDRHAVERIATLRGEITAGRMLSFRAAAAIDAGVASSHLSAMAKLAGARLAQRAADVSVDLLGLEGLAEGPSAPILGRAAGLYRASVGSSIAGGTAEIQQLVIARRGLGL